MLEEEHVPTAFDLSEVRQESNTYGVARWHCHRDDFGESIGTNIGRYVGNDRPPVMADDDGVSAATECISKCKGVHR